MKPTFFAITGAQAKIMNPVTSTGTHDVRNDFETDGLFSTRIFGELGTPTRMETFSYVKLNTAIMSPHLYHEIIRLSAFYGDIIAGRKFAKWNAKAGTFEESDFDEGDTGYGFFVSHVNDIKWAKTTSKTRDQKIAMLKKYSDVLLLDKFAIIPAGIRDYIVKDGKGVEDEINPIYRKLLNLTFLLEGSDGYAKINDGIRLKIQSVVQEIYAHIMMIQEGKNGFIQGQWTKRQIMGGTRNVITGSVVKVKDLKTDKTLGLNDSIVGIYQYAKGLSTKLDFALRSKFLDRLLGDGSENSIQLVDPKTGKFATVKNPTKSVTKFLTIDGLENQIINRLRILTYTHNPIQVGDYYLMNIYDDGKLIRPMFDNILPDGFDVKHVRPMTLVDIVALATLKESKKAVGLMTRYPITGQGSIYPTKLHVKTTIKDRQVAVLGEDWLPEYELTTYPIQGVQLYTSMAVHHSKLRNLGADHDGDKLSLTILYTKEAIEQVSKLLKSAHMYIRPDGSWVNSLNNAITGFVLKHVTRGLSKIKKK